MDRFHLGFFGLKASDAALTDQLERLARANDRLFVVTLGAEGSIALGGERRLECPAVPVPRVVDTTGAGDAFAAGFVSEYCRSKDIRESLRRGSEKAAESLGRVGAFDSELTPWRNTRTLPRKGSPLRFRR
jgi:sugar/nucleoside kinase (ribokinase family)